MIDKAITGEEGIDLCEKNHPDIIILDIMLPDMEGYEVCQKDAKNHVRTHYFLVGQIR